MISARLPAPRATLPTHDGVSALLPIVGGLAGLGLAAYQPKLAIGAGSLTLLIAAILKKGSTWWILGTIFWASFPCGSSAMKN